MKTIRKNNRGDAVVDVQKRLRVLGYELAADSIYGTATAKAVEQFRASEGLPEGDTVDEITWHALVDASFALGDRILYLRLPHFHGHDVKELQKILSVLGFFPGDYDGIFGPHTESALRDFQSSVGLPDDGIVGQITFATVQRLHHAWEGKTTTHTPEPEMHTSFARAAESLEHLEACFFGLDEAGRQVARRITNLAHATLETARVSSADAMHEYPSANAYMIGIGTDRSEFDKTCPIVIYANDWRLEKRIETALTLAKSRPCRIYVEIPESMISPDVEPCIIQGERWNQHIAVTILDAICNICLRRLS